MTRSVRRTSGELETHRAKNSAFHLPLLQGSYIERMFGELCDQNPCRRSMDTAALGHAGRLRAIHHPPLFMNDPALDIIRYLIVLCQWFCALFLDSRTRETQ